jgi:nucleoside triphosphate diphosphatase
MQEDTTFDDALAMMRDLRARCDWDRAQTHDSLRPYLIEEAHELDDAIRAGAAGALRDELGDMLLQVLFHAVIAEERGEFRAREVPAALVAKMKRRHPHLFGGGDREPWERMKSRARTSLAEGLPAGLPSLHRAHRLQERAAGVCFDWPDTDGPARKVEEELAEVREHLAGRPHRAPAGADAVPLHDDAHRALEAELGDLLFAAVNLCRRAGVHAAVALDRANDKFVRRFEAVESLVKARGLKMGEASLAELDALWDEVKASE